MEEKQKLLNQIMTKIINIEIKQKKIKEYLTLANIKIQVLTDIRLINLKQ